MKWFFRWLYNGISEIETEEKQTREEVGFATQAGLVARRPRGSNSMRIGLAKNATEDSHSVNLNQSPLVFRLYPATGGHIVEYSYYDEKTDRNTQALHLIASDADLGDSLSKIMTLEALKR
jgi:hypothetical protein